MDENPLTHNPCDRKPKRCTGVVTIRLLAMTGRRKNKEIPGGLNGMIGAQKQDDVRRIYNCAERGQLYSMIDRENIRVNATKYPRPS